MSTQNESIMGLLGHDDSYLTTLVTDPNQMLEDITITLRKMKIALDVEYERGRRHMNYAIRSDPSYSSSNEQEYEYFIRKSPNFIKNEIDERLDEYTKFNTLDMSLLQQSRPLTKNAAQFDITDVSEEDVSLEIRYWSKKDNCYYSTDTNYCNPFDCPILMNIGGQEHGKLFDRRGEDILEYQVDIQHPYMIEIKNIVQKASEVATHQEEFYFKRVRLIKEQREEYIEKLNSHHTFTKSKAMYYVYKKIDAYTPHILGFSETKLRLIKNLTKKSDELMKEIDDQLEKIEVLLDEERVDHYIRLRVDILSVKNKLCDWIPNIQKTVFQITRNQTNNVACKEIRKHITSYL